MLGGRGAVQHAIAVRGPLDVAEPAGPVRVALQVGVEGDGVVAGVTCMIETQTSERCWAAPGPTPAVLGDLYLLWGMAGTPP